MGVPLPDTRHLSDEVLEALRVRVLRGCELGLTESDVAKMLGVSRETVSRWWSAYADQGLDALPSNRTGRPAGLLRTLDNTQAALLQHFIDTRSPKQLGIAAPLWSRRAVRDLIHSLYGIWMPVRTVGEYLKRWGYTAKRPRRHADDQDPKEVLQWLQQEYPLIELQAQQEFAVIYWCDETGVAADEHPRYGYARKGQAATMEVPRSHLRVNVISTVSNQGKIHYKTYVGTLNATRFIEFLEQLLRETTKKIYLITDRLSAHDCAETETWLAPRKERIQVHYLPRRSPELNPDEYFNNDLKGNVHAAGLPHSKQELGDRIHAFLRTLVGLPDHVMSYFRHPCVQYAAGSKM